MKILKAEALTNWLNSLSASERTRALVLVYAKLTVFTRELFMPGRAAGREERVLHILQGLNEIHHTLANSMAAHARGAQESLPSQAFSEQIMMIEKEYRLEGFVTPAIDSVRTTHPNGRVAHIPPARD